MNYHLAVDIGASSGRHIIGYVENGKLKLQEIYRFENNIKKENGNIVWDIEHLCEEVINGIAKAKELSLIPQTVAIDTWGVDYVLLDENEKEIMPVVSYRDSRTAEIQEEIANKLPPEHIFELTGIQRNDFNTVYQLYCDKKTGKLNKAKHFLMIPAYLSYKLTGKMKNEYTLATTTAMLNTKTRDWDTEILDFLGVDRSLFGELCKPSELIGGFSEEIAQRVGYQAQVVFCASHDTASAVAACPITENGIYISSGTWSLIGAEIETPVLSEAAMNNSLSNEGGVEYRYRLLKNIMGMWLFQNIRRNLDKKYTYDEMMNMAQESDFVELIDVNSRELVAPDSMIEAVRGLLNKPDLPIGDVLNCVYNSLAQSYKNTVEQIEQITGKNITDIQIVGGGSLDKYLNRLTAKYTGKKVFTGLQEATATGNLIAQLIYSKEVENLKDARKLIKNSFDIVENC